MEIWTLELLEIGTLLNILVFEIVRMFRVTKLEFGRVIFKMIEFLL